MNFSLLNQLDNIHFETEMGTTIGQTKSTTQAFKDQEFRL